MPIFSVVRTDDGMPATDFDRGDIDLVVGTVTISSRVQPRLSMMIYVAIVDLIDGLLDLNFGKRQYEFVGAGSSFVLQFVTCKGGVRIRHGDVQTEPVALHDLLHAIGTGVDAFMAAPGNALPAHSAVHADLDDARRVLMTALAQGPGGA